MMTPAAPGGAGLAVVNEKLTSAAMESGGSLTSVSVIPAAATVTLQVDPDGSGAAGVSVNVLAGDALCVNAWGEPAGHSIANASDAAVTLSLKLMTTVEVTGTLLAELAGVVVMTDGALSTTAPFAATEKSSIARPWSLPASSGSCHRSHISWPALAVTESVADFRIRFAGAFPSRAAAEASAIGPVKLSGANVVQPVAGLFAPAMPPAFATWY